MLLSVDGPDRNIYLPVISDSLHISFNNLALTSNNYKQIKSKQKKSKKDNDGEIEEEGEEDEDEKKIRKQVS